MEISKVDKNTIKHQTSIVNISENRKEKFSTIFALGLEAFKVFMACLLSLFVSQKCSDHDCSISEKFNEEGVYAKTVLASNFITLLIFLVGYNIEFMREQFIIQHFNDNSKLPDDNISKILEPIPLLSKELHKWNERFYYVTVGSIGIGLTNFVVSGIFICTEHYNGMRTVTSLVTNILLVSNTVNSNYKISKKCHDKLLALSSSRLEPISYNDLDDKLKQTIKPEEPSEATDDNIKIEIPSTVIVNEVEEVKPETETEEVKPEVQTEVQTEAQPEETKPEKV